MKLLKTKYESYLGPSRGQGFFFQVAVSLILCRAVVKGQVYPKDQNRKQQVTGTSKAPPGP